MDDDATVALDHFTRCVSLTPKENGTSRSHQLAGAGARSLAGVFDLCLQIVTFILMALAAIHARPDLFPRTSWPWAIAVGFIEWHIIYLMLFESFTGGITPGKAIAGIRVIGVTTGKVPASRLVLRNLCRVLEILLGCYAGAFFLITTRELRQRVGDLLSGTIVIYTRPLSWQLEQSEVPASLYSTSEDGYLLEAWVERSGQLDEESRIASAIDLAAYLHAKYDRDFETQTDPATYLLSLYDAEQQHEKDSEKVAGK